MEERDPFGFVGLTYDDVMLLPNHTDVIPSEADTSTRLTRRIRIQAPLQFLSKAQIIQAGVARGVDYALTVSCYQADDEGRACGKCKPDSRGGRHRVDLAGIRP